MFAHAPQMYRFRDPYGTVWEIGQPWPTPPGGAALPMKVVFLAEADDDYVEAVGAPLQPNAMKGKAVVALIPRRGTDSEGILESLVPEREVEKYISDRLREIEEDYQAPDDDEPEPQAASTPPVALLPRPS